MNAVIYARYSSFGQNEQSIEGQLHDCEEFAVREGYTIIANYIDRARSGTSEIHRDEFLRMISDSARRQFSVVIVWKLDRFARNRYDAATNRAKLKKNGVKVISAMENITDTPEGIILEGMLESMAEYYSANLSENVRRGQRETIRKGRFAGGPPLFGYKHVDGKLVPDEITAPAIRYVFEQYANGVPKKEIIDELNRRGIKSTRGNVLSYKSFQHVMRNPTYVTGNMTFGQETVYDVATPLISQELFDRVQARMDEKKHAPATGKAIEKYILQGKAYCGMCGARLVGESGRSSAGDIHRYYACSARKKEHTCTMKPEKKRELEDYVIKQTVRYLLDPSTAHEIASRVVASLNEESETTQKIASVKSMIKKATSDIEAYEVALADLPPATVRDRIYKRIQDIEEHRAILEKDLAALEIEKGLSITESDVIAWLSQYAVSDPDNNSEEFRKQLIELFVNSVHIYPDNILILWNIAPRTPPITPDDIPPSKTSSSSDFNPNVPRLEVKSEQRFLMIKNTIGMCFKR